MRHLPTALLVVALGATGLASPSVHAAPPPPGNDGAGTSVDRFEGAATRAPARKQVRRAYGQGPVRTVPGRRYAVVFKGRKGDVVRLSPVSGHQHGWFDPGGSRLVGPKGRTVKPGASGFVRLPRKGTYRFRFTATTTRTQLVKRALRSARPGTVVAERARRGYQYVVDVRVPGARARQVTFDGSAIERAFLRGKELEDPEDIWFHDDLLLVPGQRLVRDGLRWSDVPARGGDLLRVLLPAGEKVDVRAADLGERTLRVDGPAVDLPTTGPGVVVKVPASATRDLPGGFLDVLHSAPPLGEAVLAYGPDGRLDQGSGLVSVPATGETTLLVLRDSGTTASAPATLRLSSLAAAGQEVVLDGPAVQVPVSADGRRVLVPVRAETDDLTQLVVEGAPAGGWTATAGMLTSPLYPRGCNGCGELDRVSVDQLGTSGWWFRPTRGRPWVLLSPLEGQRTGTFSVRLVRAPD